MVEEEDERQAGGGRALGGQAQPPCVASAMDKPLVLLVRTLGSAFTTFLAGTKGRIVIVV